MKVALYARVSTDDKGQNVEVQLTSLRAWCERLGWDIFREYSDEASAADFIKRKQWALLMKDAALRKFDVVMTWDLSRAFRVLDHGARTIKQLKAWGIGFKTYQYAELFDSTGPMAEFMINNMLAYAEFERTFGVVKVNEGIAYAKVHGTKSGKPIGRPRKNIDFKNVLEACRANIGIKGLPNYSRAATDLTKTTGIRITPGFVQHRLLAGAAERQVTVQELMEVS